MTSWWTPATRRERVPERHPSQRKLLVVELALPPSDVPPLGKLLNAHVLVLCSVRERTAAEYAALLEAADYAFTRAVRTLAGPSVSEAVPE